MTNELDVSHIELVALESKTRQFMLGLRKLRKRQQHASAPDGQEEAMAIDPSEVPLNRRSRMTHIQDARVEFVIEELEDFTSISKMMILEPFQNPQHPQRQLFETIFCKFQTDMERFTNDLLLATRDRQEISRRIEAG